MANPKPPYVLKNLPHLWSHLSDHYGIEVSEVTELDLGVLRVDCRDGPSWVARVFPATRPVDDVRRDAELLARLERGGFPSERLAQSDAVTEFEGQGVLVTTYVAGSTPRGNGRTFAYLGGLLGALHSRDVVDVAPGGGWHHLVSSGTPKDEVAALQGLLREYAPSVKRADVKSFDSLRAHVNDIDDADDLPHCLVHPDMVPANAIEVDDRSIVIVDWANAGRGPRLWSLAMTLFAAGARDMRLVEKVISRYVKRSSLASEELDRLEGALSARPITIHAWEIVHQRSTLGDSPATLRFLKRLAGQIAEAARESFELERG